MIRLLFAIVSRFALGVNGRSQGLRVRRVEGRGFLPLDPETLRLFDSSTLRP
jgi:hypothetical protein